MKAHDRSEMNNPSEGHIRQSLKNWASRHKPPANGRARLLLVAASTTSPRAQTGTQKEKSSYLDFFKTIESPSDRAIGLQTFPWLLAAQFSFTPHRRVT